MSRAPQRSTSGSRPRVARVLVVDDELLVVQSLRLVLSREFQVVGTADPRVALDWLRGGETYDVILCDVTMPALSGVELRDQLESFAPEQAARIVFVTGGLIVPEIRAMLDDIPNTVLEKPIDVDGLRELIRRRVRAAWQETGHAI